MGAYASRSISGRPPTASAVASGFAYRSPAARIPALSAIWGAENHSPQQRNCESLSRLYIMTRSIHRLFYFQSFANKQERSLLPRLLLLGTPFAERASARSCGVHLPQRATG